MDERGGSTTTPDDPYHDFRTIRFLSFALIALGSLGWGSIALFFTGYRGRPLSPGEMLSLYGPFLYLLAFFLSCFSFVRGRALAALCLIFNAPLALLTVYLLVHLSIAGVVLSIFPVMWVLLCTERLKLERAAVPDNDLRPTPP
jgi:hypothetical protein